jgi:hypothetical protein
VSTLPFMANVGNHEHTPGKLTNASGTYDVDYAAYQARYGAVPANGNGNLWYSFDYGSAHYVYVDSEEAQSPGSPQIQWLAADLAAVDRAVTPWLFLFQHRPLLCSTKSEQGDHVPGGTFLRNLEALILAHEVDLVITGCAARAAEREGAACLLRERAVGGCRCPAYFPPPPIPSARRCAATSTSTSA